MISEKRLAILLNHHLCDYKAWMQTLCNLMALALRFQLGFLRLKAIHAIIVVLSWLSLQRMVSAADIVKDAGINYAAVNSNIHKDLLLIIFHYTWIPQTFKWPDGTLYHGSVTNSWYVIQHTDTFATYYNWLVATEATAVAKQAEIMHSSTAKLNSCHIFTPTVWSRYRWVELIFIFAQHWSVTISIILLIIDSCPELNLLHSICYIQS